MLRLAGVWCSEIMSRTSIGRTDKYQESPVIAVGFRSVLGNSTSRKRIIPDAVVINYWPKQKQQTAVYKKTVATFEIFRMQERRIRPKELNNSLLYQHTQKKKDQGSGMKKSRCNWIERSNRAQTKHTAKIPSQRRRPEYLYCLLFTSWSWHYVVPTRNGIMWLLKFVSLND